VRYLTADLPGVAFAKSGRPRQVAASGSSPPEAASFWRRHELDRRGGDRSAVFFRVQLCGVLVVLGRMQMMPVRDLGMVGGLFVIAGLVVLGGLAMMLRRVLVVMRGLLMMLMNFVSVHRTLPG
jgi:hypothetical protein